MHHFYYLAVFPVTALTIAGYVTLYCAKHSEGRMRTAGRLLSSWAFLLALLILAVAIIHPAIGDGPFGPGGHFGHMGTHMDSAPMLDHGVPGDEAAPQPSAAAPPPSAPDSKLPNPTGWKTE